MKRERSCRGFVPLTQAALIAAAYTVFTVIVPPLSFGAIQLRLSEALTVLPVCFPSAIPGLTVGCLLSNFIGLSSGLNPAGGWDLLLGTLATALAAVGSYALRRVTVRGLPLFSTLCPVISNGLIVGAELYWLYGGFPLPVHMLWIAVGELLPCTVGGLLLYTALRRVRVNE